MKKLLFVTFFISCSQNQVKQNTTSVETISDAEIFSEEGLSSISNDDFKVPVQVPFNPRVDNYPSTLPLSKETFDHDLKQVSDDLEPGDELGQAVKYCYHKDFTEAFELFNKIYRKYQKNPAYFNQVGTCYYLKNDKRMALIFYNRARDLDDKYVPAINNVGVMLLKEGKNQKALEAFKKARELRPFSKTPSYNLAHLYVKYGLIEEALEIFKLLYKEHPSDIEIQNGLAHALLLKGDVEAALAKWETLDEDQIRDPRFGLSYSLALKINKQDGNARTVYLSIQKSKLSGLESYYSNIGKYLGVNP